MEGRVAKIITKADNVKSNANKRRNDILKLTQQNILKEDRKQIRIKRQKTKALDRILNASLNGLKDVRWIGKKCPRCQKQNIHAELHDGSILEDNKTLCSFIVDKKKNVIQWNSHCMTCQVEYRKKHNQTLDGFTNVLAQNLRIHVDGDIHDMKIVIESIRNRCKGFCKSCGISLIQKQKSGWRQETINVRSPELFTIGKRTVDEVYLSQSCLACNAFQNNFSWKQHLQNLIELCNIPHQQNTDFSKIHKNWVHDIGSRKYLIKLPQDLLSIQGKYCAASGIEMKFIPGYWNSVSIDKIDGKKGYVFENCRLVCKCINFVKNFSIDESQLQEWIQHIRAVGPDILTIYNKAAMSHLWLLGKTE